MSIASRITEIETHIGDVYDTINYSYDTTGVNKNIINIPKYLNKGYIDIINNGIDNLYNNFPKVSGTGSNLSLTPTYEAPIKLNEIQGNTLQDGTPTPDTPVEIQSVTGLQNVEVCGKNLLNIPDGTYSNNGITAIVENGKITLNGTASATSFISIPIEIKLEDNKDYMLSANNSTGIGNNTYWAGIRFMYNSVATNPLMFTNANATKVYNFNEAITINELTIRTNKDIEYSNYVIYSQLEQNSTATTYEPYKGNTYEVNLGKNLLDTSKFTSTTQATSINSNTSEIDLITNNYGNFITIFDNLGIQQGNYTIWCEVVSGTYTGGNLCFFDLSGTQYSTEFNFKNDNTHIKQINLTNGLNKLRIYSPKCESDTKIKIWLIKGNYTRDTIPSFSPYFTPIELNEIDDYQDSIKKSTGKNLCTGVRKSSSNNDLFFDFSNNISQTITLSATINSQTQGNSIYLSVDGVSKGKVGEMTGTANTKQTTTITFTNEMYEAIQNSTTCFLQLYRNNAGFVIPNDGQINNGSTALPYEPYGKVWYEEKYIQKVIINENSPTYQSGNLTNVMRMACNSGYTLISDTRALYCDKLQVDVGYTHDYEQIYLTNNNFYIFINKSRGVTDNTTFKTWLASNNLICYVVLATPTYTEITNEELINQLEALYTAKSQEGTTNISITSEDLEMILNVSALKGEE